jgi:hypothetical protein
MLNMARLNMPPPAPCLKSVESMFADIPIQPLTMLHKQIKHGYLWRTDAGFVSGVRHGPSARGTNINRSCLHSPKRMDAKNTTNSNHSMHQTPSTPFCMFHYPFPLPFEKRSG